MTDLPSFDIIGGATSWAEQVEAETRLPPRQETVKGDIRTVTEYHNTDGGHRTKVVSTFKIETRRVRKSIASRKQWQKFGSSSRDGHGPNPATTYPGEAVLMQFVRNRAGDLLLGDGDVDDPLAKLKAQSGSALHCRLCKQKDHWSVNCPFKDLFPDEEKNGDASQVEMEAQRQKEVDDKRKAGTYVPPNLREGAAQAVGARGGTMMDMRSRDENTVRVTNLPEDTEDTDLRELFGNIGKITRIFLAKDKATGRSKGFAFVTYERRQDADKAILTISGHRYEHLILKVEWARPNNP